MVVMAFMDNKRPEVFASLGFLAVVIVALLILRAAHEITARPSGTSGC